MSRKARLPRICLSGIPQHIIAAHVGPSTCGTCKCMHIARGNNRQATFYAEADYHKYLETLNEAAIVNTEKGDGGIKI